MAEYVSHPQQAATKRMKLVDGVFMLETTFPAAGMIAPQHAHSYDHVSYIAAGAARVFADNVWLGDFQAPVPLVIRAKVKHRFEVLKPGTVVLCIHNADRAEGDVALHEEHHLEGVG